jgi:hypothetical protein
MNWQISVLIIAVVASVVISVLGRYELVAVPAGGQGVHGIVYRLDRWTGEVTSIAGPNGVRVEIK